MLKKILLLIILSLFIAIVAYVLKPLFFPKTILLDFSPIYVPIEIQGDPDKNENFINDKPLRHIHLIAQTNAIVQGQGFHLIAKVDSVKHFYFLPPDERSMFDGAILVSEKMKITLNNESINAFKIEPKNSDIQQLTGDSALNYDWYVTPLQSGRQKILLRASLVNNDSYRDQMMSVDIFVQPGYFYVGYSWFVQYFEIISGALGTLLIERSIKWMGAGYRRWKEKKRRKEKKRIGFQVNSELD